MLTSYGTHPNSLHINLLRLYQNAEKVRIVTKNFDTLFETAAQQIWGRTPEVYTAPAFPLGKSFTGIVHIHGAVPKPESHGENRILQEESIETMYNFFETKMQRLQF